MTLLEAQQLKKHGNQWCFSIKVTYVKDKVLDPNRKYNILISEDPYQEGQSEPRLNNSGDNDVERSGYSDTYSCGGNPDCPNISNEVKQRCNTTKG